MQSVICDGCGKHENVKIVEKNRDIKSVKLSVVLDTRESVPNGNERYEADLCTQCRDEIAQKYFREKDGSVLEIPSFLEVVKSG